MKDLHLIQNDFLTKGGYILLDDRNTRTLSDDESIDRLLTNFMGKEVIVDVRRDLIPNLDGDAKDFDNCMRLLGKLEYNGKQYRVLVNNSIYVYFQTKNIQELGSHGENVSEDNFSKYASCFIGIKF